MSSVLAAIRAAHVAQLGAIADIGIVNDRERYLPDEAQFKAAYVYTPAGGDPQLRGWWLRRVRTEERTISTGSVLVEHTWQWRGYMAFNDAQASELAFDELIEAYRDAHRADPTLGGVCEQNPEGIGGTDGVQVEQAGPVMFCGALCHSVVLQLKTWSYVDL
jgi:hypothetical protein